MLFVVLRIRGVGACECGDSVLEVIAADSEGEGTFQPFFHNQGVLPLQSVPFVCAGGSANQCEQK